MLNTFLLFPEIQVVVHNVHNNDIDDIDNDPDFIPSTDLENNLPNRNTAVPGEEPDSSSDEEETQAPKSRKRLKNPSNWLQNKRKLLVNTGESFKIG